MLKDRHALVRKGTMRGLAVQAFRDPHRTPDVRNLQSKARPHNRP